VPSGPSTYHAIVQRSDGSLDDPSVAAGMKPIRSGKVGGASGNGIEIMACDPHDPSVIYAGSLLPTTSPMSLHCGPTFAVRASGPDSFEARCDIPINGSPLVGVRAHRRHAPHVHHRHRKGRHVHGGVPYAMSVTSHGAHPRDALEAAVRGAILCGDAAELHTTVDRYKLLALQGALCGMPAQEIHRAVVGELAACGCPPQQANAIAGEAVRGAARMAKGTRPLPHMPGQGVVAFGAQVVR
jgi:hypothetical protein